MGWVVLHVMIVLWHVLLFALVDPPMTVVRASLLAGSGVCAGMALSRAVR
jgi:hypothetical protein